MELLSLLPKSSKSNFDIVKQIGIVRAIVRLWMPKCKVSAFKSNLILKTGNHRDRFTIMELRESVMVSGVAATITIPVSRYKDTYWGIPCLRSGTNFELQIEVHRRERENFDRAFHQWISKTFECMLGTEKEAAEILEQVAKNGPNNIARLSEEVALARAKQSRSPTSFFRKQIYRASRLVTNDEDKDRARWQKMMQSLSVWHLASRIKGGINITFEKTQEGSLAREVDEWIPKNATKSEEGNKDLDEEKMMEAVQKTESIRQNKMPVEKKMRDLRVQHANAKSAHGRLVLAHGNEPSILPLRHIKDAQNELLKCTACVIKIDSIALAVMETCDNGSSLSYLCSMEAITVYLHTLEQELGRMPENLESAIDSLQQQIGWSIKNGVCEFACLSEAEKAKFVNATRTVRRFQPMWVIPGVIASGLTFRYSKVASCLLLGASVVFAFRPTPAVTGDIECTPEEAVRKYRELLGIKERAHRLEVMRNTIKDFIAKNPKCATVMLEHCPGEDPYILLSQHCDVFEF